MIIREHVFNNTPASDKCTVPGCGVPYAERERSCVNREVPRPVPVSVFADLGAIGDRRKDLFGTPAHYDKEGK